METIIPKHLHSKIGTSRSSSVQPSGKVRPDIAARKEATTIATCEQSKPFEANGYKRPNTNDTSIRDAIAVRDHIATTWHVRDAIAVRDEIAALEIHQTWNACTEKAEPSQSSQAPAYPKPRAMSNTVAIRTREQGTHGHEQHTPNA